MTAKCISDCLHNSLLLYRGLFGMHAMKTQFALDSIKRCLSLLQIKFENYHISSGNANIRARLCCGGDSQRYSPGQTNGDFAMVVIHHHQHEAPVSNSWFCPHMRNNRIVQLHGLICGKKMTSKWASIQRAQCQNATETCHKVQPSNTFFIQRCNDNASVR